MLPSMAMGEGPSSCTLHFTLLIKTYVKILNVLYKIVIKETQSLILSLDWPMKNIPKFLPNQMDLHLVKHKAANLIIFLTALAKSAKWF